MNFTHITVGKIVFGPGRFRDIGKESAALGSRVLLVSGRGFLRRTGRLDEIMCLFAECGMHLTLFDAVPPEPSISVVEEGIRIARAQGCDIVTAVGGGSALDVGKTIAGLATSSVSVIEHFQGLAVQSKGLPFVAVATTAGSGAEVTPNAVLIDEEHGVKASIRSHHLLADVAIVDPELTLSCPPETTAFSGMDALCQALEAYVSKGAVPLTDALARDAAVRLMRHLPVAHRNGDDITARSEVALGSLMGAMAFSNARLGLVHGMAHPVGVLTGLPHGLICGLLLPPVMRLNTSVAAGKYAEVARTLGLVDCAATDDDAARALIAEVESLNARMGLDEYTPRLRVPKDKWHDVTTQTLSSGSTKSNPYDVTAWEVQQILDSFQFVA